MLTLDNWASQARAASSRRAPPLTVIVASLQ